jgi:hypothetical protein
MPILIPLEQPSLAPKQAEVAIPTRVVSTKPKVRPIENAEQSTKAETPAVAESTPTAESVKLSPEAATRARQEQVYRQREQALKQRELDLEAKLKEAEQYSQLKAKLAAKDYSAIETLGINYDGLTEYELAKQAGEPPEEIKAINSLKAEVDALKKGQEEHAAKEYEATVAEYKKEISALVASKPEFEAIKTLGHEDAVLQLILDAFEEGEELTIEEAAADVKTFLKEEAKRLEILLDKPAEPERKLPPPKGLRTLNNSVQVGATPPSTKPLSQLPESQRYAEAMRRVLARKESK